MHDRLKSKEVIAIIIVLRECYIRDVKKVFRIHYTCTENLPGTVGFLHLVIKGVQGRDAIECFTTVLFIAVHTHFIMQLHPQV